MAEFVALALAILAYILILRWDARRS